MKQIVWIINCYLYGATLILLVVLALLVYLRGQANHLPNPFARRNIVYRPKEKAQGVLLGKKFGLMAYSPNRTRAHPRNGAIRHRQDKCPTDSDFAELAGHGSCC